MELPSLRDIQKRINGITPSEPLTHADLKTINSYQSAFSDASVWTAGGYNGKILTGQWYSIDKLGDNLAEKFGLDEDQKLDLKGAIREYGKDISTGYGDMPTSKDPSTVLRLDNIDEATKIIHSFLKGDAPEQSGTLSQLQTGLLLSTENIIDEHLIADPDDGNNFQRYAENLPVSAETDADQIKQQGGIDKALETTAEAAPAAQPQLNETIAPTIAHQS